MAYIISMITLAKTLPIIIIITSHKIFYGYGYLVRSIILNRVSGIYIRLLTVLTCYFGALD